MLATFIMIVKFFFTDSALQKQITMMKSQLEEYKQTDIELTKGE